MNSAVRAVLPLLLFFCLTAALSAWGKKEEKASPPQAQEQAVPAQEAQGVLVQVSGRVRLVGNEPFPDIVISGPEMSWYIAREEMHILKDLQHRTVTVEGIETVRQLTFASGRPAGERRTLKDIKIINIE